MRNLIKENETYFWIIVIGTILLSIYLTLWNLTDEEYGIVEQPAAFINYQYKSSVSGKISRTSETCQFFYKGENFAFINYDGNCSNLKTNELVILKLKKIYTKYSWQTYYAYHSSQLLKVIRKDGNEKAN